MRFSLGTALGLCMLMAACAQPSPETDETPEQTVQFEPVGNTVEDARHGREVAFAVTALSGTEGIAANGMASLHRFTDKATIVGVRLNINPAEDGLFYMAQLENDDGSQYLTLGNLKNSPGDAKHTLAFETNTTVDPTLTHLRIYAKKDAAREQPGTLVATGLFKLTRR
jgi:hypothetical protein